MHAALVYDSDEDFLAAAVPYLSEGLHRDEGVLAVTTAHNIGLLRAHLPGRGAGADFADSTAWYVSPGATLFAYDEFVRAQEADGRPTRILGEPVWSGRSLTHRRAWQRYESLLNLAFAGRDVHCVCPYDARAVDEAVLATARRTHPALATGNGGAVSGDYVDPQAFCEECDRFPLPPPVDPVAEIGFAIDRLAVARAFVRRNAEAAGLQESRVLDAIVAVNEITTNAVRHGGGGGRLRSWREDHSLVFEVHDMGPHRPDPLAGQLRPPAEAELSGGYGLWTARQLCDLVEVRDGPGWVVRLYLQVPPG